MRRELKWVLPTAAVAGAAAFAASGAADPNNDLQFRPVPSANPRAAGYAPASRLAGGLQQLVWARGSTKLENPDGIIGWYGYENDKPSPDNPDLPQMVPATSSATEAQKTEPDENTYLRFRKSLGGPDKNYYYGKHFLYQGHEGAAPAEAGNFGKQGYLTRINLDANSDHRVTLMATRDANGKRLATIDGSAWEPFAKRLLLTTENTAAPTYAATASYPSKVDDLSGSLGRGGYEGVQDDSDGNIWIVEDIGGKNKPDDGDATNDTKAKRPNSFVYRYVPAKPGDLRNGKLQVLQVLAKDGHPITFESQAAINNPDQIELHSYGNSLTTKWVTIHDTSGGNTAPFIANDLAKAAHGTPFKRPENGRFRPGSGFRQFFFDETGDTDATSPENPTAGGWGAAQKLVQSSPSASTGKLTLFYYNDQQHAAFDNITFLTKDLITFVEDAGDTLHKQRNALDSGWVLNAKRDYSRGGHPLRWLAQGRDASATLDAANGGFGSNDQDNEITGAIVSNGDPTKKGILGAREPRPFKDHWRWFYTQQHGDNVTYEVIPLL